MLAMQTIRKLSTLSERKLEMQHKEHNNKNLTKLVTLAKLIMLNFGDMSAENMETNAN
jgi:hypothetical protein